jgi:hypothetical protein
MKMAFGFMRANCAVLNRPRVESSSGTCTVM